MDARTQMLTVTCDQNADLKRLRKLELAGLVELWCVSIEELKNTRRIAKGRKEPPIIVIGSPHSTWGNAMVASADTPYSELEEIIGRQNHADVLHLERHIESGRDVFATSDKDFLAHRATLESRFSIQIRTVEELVRDLDI
ncbi:hypothetical protein [Roseovarius aestuarii]|uniref:hypothetical protein n=1 Tax=Roseovarius aestuarii TaxID=475083 RepID=UPI000A26D129|nr:hypothetical protein [Roseovarius aestuarii]